MKEMRGRNKEKSLEYKLRTFSESKTLFRSPFLCFPRANSLVRGREGRGNKFALGNEDRKVFFSVNPSFFQELF